MQNVENRFQKLELQNFRMQIKTTECRKCRVAEMKIRVQENAKNSNVENRNQNYRNAETKNKKNRNNRKQKKIDKNKKKLDSLPLTLEVYIIPNVNMNVKR